jgi:hypothetical protein
LVRQVIKDFKIQSRIALDLNYITGLYYRSYCRELIILDRNLVTSKKQTLSELPQRFELYPHQLDNSLEERFLDQYRYGISFGQVAGQGS